MKIGIEALPAALAQHADDPEVPDCGDLIILQHPRQNAQCNPHARPTLKQTEKPPCLKVDEERWSEVVLQLQSILKGYWSVLLPLSLTIAALVTVFVSMAINFFFFTIFPRGLFAVSIVLTLPMVIYGHHFVVKKNHALDLEIKTLCAQLSLDAGMDVEYRTDWTGFVKPPWEGITRIIAIDPLRRPQVIPPP